MIRHLKIKAAANYFDYQFIISEISKAFFQMFAASSCDNKLAGSCNITGREIMTNEPQSELISLLHVKVQVKMIDSHRLSIFFAFGSSPHRLFLLP